LLPDIQVGTGGLVPDVPLPPPQAESNDKNEKTIIADFHALFIRPLLNEWIPDI
jgi:hypothetical protein